MRWISTALPLLLFLLPASVAAQGSRADSATIRRAAEDYINGFYAGDTVRVRRALYPGLVKRQATGQAGALEQQSVEDLVGITAQMIGRAPGLAAPADSIRLLDLDRDMALVRIGVPQWVDYLQLARVGETWLIVNVLWELRR